MRLLSSTSIFLALLATQSFADTHVIDTVVTAPNAGLTLAPGDVVTVTETGEARTDGISATGVDGLELQNHGIIALSDGPVYLTGGSLAVTNFGAIEFRPGYYPVSLAYGAIRLTGDNAQVENQGTIYSYSSGIRITGDSAQVLNSGRISTLYDVTSGIGVAGDHAAIRNLGTIETRDFGSSGISVQGDNGSVENAGTITTDGMGSIGIRVDGDDASVENAGMIELREGFASTGIMIFGDGATLTNSGVIVMERTAGHGVIIRGQDAVFINTGSILNNGVGVSFEPTSTLNLTGNVRFVNSGTITAPHGVDALELTGGGAALEFLRGSQVAGLIRFFSDSQGNATVTIGAGLSTVLEFSHRPGTLSYSGALAVDGTSYHFADLSGLWAGQGAGLAGSALVQDVALSRPRAGSWAQVLGRAHHASATDSMVSHSGYLAGVGFGHDAGDWALFVGILTGHQSGSAAFSADSLSGYIGLSHALNDQIDLSLTLGYLDQDLKRVVSTGAGVETATSSPSALLFSPAITLRDAFGWQGLQAGLRYTAMFNRGFTERGTTSPISVTGHTTHQIDVRLGKAVPLAEDLTGLFGVDLSHRSGSEIDLTLAGLPTTPPGTKEGFTTRAFAHWDFAKATRAGHTLNATGELGVTHHGALDLHLGLEMRF